MMLVLDDIEIDRPDWRFGEGHAKGNFRVGLVHFSILHQVGQEYAKVGKGHVLNVGPLRDRC